MRIVKIKVLKADGSLIYIKPITQAVEVDNELSIWKVDKRCYQGSTLEIICKTV